MKIERIEPYRLFFPLGILFGILGVWIWVRFGLWAQYGLGTETTYAKLFHGEVMVGGFLFCFAMGFVMTAVPRFLGSYPATRMEKTSSVIALIILLVGALIGDRILFHLVSFVVLALLVRFYLKRSFTATHTPPSSFRFLFLGLMMGLVGAGIIILYDFWDVPKDIQYFGRLLYTQGMFLGFVLGVGSRMIPAILGQGRPSNGLIRSQVPIKSHNRIHWGLIFLTLSFPIEVWLHARGGQALRAAVVLWIVLVAWKIYKQPRVPGPLSSWIWVSAWSLVIGVWLQPLIPKLSIHGLHLAFIGGFGLITLMLASMVTLSHGGHDMTVIRKSKLLTSIGVLIFVAALTRAVAPLTDEAYILHLLWAAILWLVGLGLWSWGLLPKILKIRQTEERSSRPG